MFIEAITIDGFKSYSRRTEVAGFDPCFNAITGLNGTGKSNILDSICFVLGITNLSQVRVSSLQELVYKQGQAGITKASVSIDFNNAEKSTSPVGYEHHDRITVTRQLVVGGRNKYMINGQVAQPSRVTNMLHSVQLNVNNPHFLIMQGRITKVLNMKPAETLGMLEEAAGTRMYEDKKEKAKATIRKKQVKLDEINRVLSEDIVPALEKLRKEKADFTKYQQAKADLDRQGLFVTAHAYYLESRRQETAKADQAATIEDLAVAKEDNATAENVVEAARAKLKALKDEKEQRGGAEIRLLQAEVAQHAKELVQKTTACDHRQEEYATEHASLEALQTQAAELSSSGKAEALTAAAAARDEAAGAHEAAKAAVEAATRELAGAEAGDGRDDSNRSLAQRLAEAKRNGTAAAAEAKAAAILKKGALSEMEKLKRAATSKGKESSKAEQDLAKQKAAAQAAKIALADFPFDPAALAAAEEEVAAAAARQGSAQSTLDALGQHLGGMQFRWKNPGGRIPEGAVKGVLGRLIQRALPLDGVSTSAALEVAAGGKLYQVVVDSAATGKALLAPGIMERRTTLCPLDKVDSRCVSEEKKRKVFALVGDKAVLALDLVQYDTSLTAAMRFAFGNTFICKDQDSAQTIALGRSGQPGAGCRAVSLDGDDFSPGGTVTGGKRRDPGRVLEACFAAAAAEAAVGQAKAEITGAKQHLADLTPAAQQHSRLARQVELADHQLALIQERVSHSEASVAAAAAEAAATAAEEACSALEAAERKRVEASAAAQALEKDIANLAKDRTAHTKVAAAKLKAAKAAVDGAREAARDKAAAAMAAAAEQEASEKELAEVDAQISAMSPAIQDLGVAVAQLQEAAASATRAMEGAQAALEARRAETAAADVDIRMTGDDVAQAQERQRTVAKEQRRLEGRSKDLEKQAAEAAAHLKALEKEFPFIASEKATFGRRGGPYDWEGRDVLSEAAAHRQNKQTVEELGMKVNKRVSQMFDKAESEARDLQERKRIVETDKSKIYLVIEELDEMKKKSLETTWEKVNIDFGNIFASLLGQTSAAKLVPPDGQDFLQGLEVRVAFNGLWKDSLTELSGGQRSLLALSLILAMLLFKPAPIYILDEVDAALDGSHTENVGAMIREHFPQSQFLVVSLKEGMFKNADVRFTTSLVDGSSTVTRTTPHRSARELAARAAKGLSRLGPNATRPALRENVPFS